MIKVVLFDADGVLINGEMFSSHLSKDYGISKETTMSFFTTILPKCVIGELDLKEVLPPYLATWGWKGSVDEFITYWHISEHTIDNELIKYIQMLRGKGILCCLATNQTKYRASYMLKEMGFENSFDKMYASAHLGHRKPEQAFYQKVVDDLRVNKEDVLFWDDSEENITAARNFGMHAEVYTSFAAFQEVMREKYKL